MKIQINVKVRDIVIKRFLEKNNLKIEQHDFGYWRNEHHNRPVWVEDIRDAVLFKLEWIKAEELFALLAEKKVERFIDSL